MLSKQLLYALYPSLARGSDDAWCCRCLGGSTGGTHRGSNLPGTRTHIPSSRRSRLRPEGRLRRSTHSAPRVCVADGESMMAVAGKIDNRRASGMMGVLAVATCVGKPAARCFASWFFVLNTSSIPRWSTRVGVRALLMSLLLVQQVGERLEATRWDEWRAEPVRTCATLTFGQ